MPSENTLVMQRPNPLACTKCRAKHLKCDANTPICGRCQKHGLACSYIRSKRGLRGPKDYETVQSSPVMRRTTDPGLCRNDMSEHDAIGQSDFLWNWGFNNIPSAELQGVLGGSDLVNGQSTFLHGSNDMSNDISLASPQPIPSESFRDGDDMFIDLFYTQFHPTHPFVIPRQLLRQTDWTIPGQLRVAIVFAGSHFTQSVPISGTRERAMRLLKDPAPEDGYRVQALLLLALTFHARFEEQESLAAFEKAAELALKLRMFDKTYANFNDYGNETIAESWRRTWWELVAVDVLLPTFHPRQYESRLQNVEVEPYLPSEEQYYASCRPSPQLKTRDDFDKRLFMDDEYQYSSYAYKIEAIRLLHSVRGCLVDPDETLQESIDNSLSNFFLSLPPNKREVVGVNGNVDEVLFSAHLITNVASLLFHRTHSSFAFLNHRQPTQCTMQEGPRMAMYACPQRTSKALRAADDLSNAIGAHLSLKRRSPFLTCAVALASSIHLPAYMMQCYATERPVLKERLQLSISALQMIGEVWAIARVVRAQVSRFAREVLFGTLPCSGQMPLETDLQLATPSARGDDSWLDQMSESGLIVGENQFPAT